MKSNKYKESDLFNKGRICDYCGTNQDTKDIESLEFLHADCWKWYRLDRKIYRIPDNYPGKKG